MDCEVRARLVTKMYASTLREQTERERSKSQKTKERLPGEVGEGFIGLCHLMHVFALLHRIPFVL